MQRQTEVLMKSKEQSVAELETHTRSWKKATATIYHIKKISKRFPCPPSTQMEHCLILILGFKSLFHDVKVHSGS